MDGIPENTYAFGPAAEGKPRKIVLMLHGLGSNGQDLIGLAPLLAQELPDVLFLSPDAPHDYDMAPPGFGFQWFSLRSFAHDDMLEGAKGAEPGLNAYIDAVLERTGLQAGDLALLGFSQGTMMSLFAAVRRKGKLAGVLGYSGALLGGSTLKSDALAKVPVCLLHGEADDVVPVSRYNDALRDLKAAGFDVEGQTFPGLQHSINDGGIAAGIAFLKKNLS